MKGIRDSKPLLMGMDLYIPDHIIDRGYEYYQQGLVEEVRIKEPWIYATVLGNYGDYSVHVHMSEFNKSRCDCPYEGYCKHMAAVVYYVTEEYADKPGYSEPAGSPCACATDETGAGVAEAAAQQPKLQLDNDLAQRLKSMEREDLLETIEQLMETSPSLQEMIRLIILERERTANLHSDKVRQMGLYTSLAYYQKEIPAVLKECESWFTEIEMDDDDEDDYWEYGYRHGDETSAAEWDFTMGLDKLHRYGQELLKLVTAEHYISGTVGLLVAVVGLEDWSAKYEDEYSESELTDGCLDFENYLWEALELVGQYQFHDPQAQTFLQELIEWIVNQCKQLDDLIAWTSVLTHCVPDLRYLWHLKKRIMLLDKDFLLSTRLRDERHRRILVNWWVELCLSLNQEEEAKRTASIVEGSFQSDTSVAYCFVRYYERRENWHEAVKALQTILNASSRSNPHDYQWIIRLCERSGNELGVKDWYEKWFLAHPAFDLFRQNVAIISNDADKEGKIQKWIDFMSHQKEYTLVIGMYLYLDDIDKAWAAFVKHKGQIQMDEPLLIKLFREMKNHNPAKLIPLYRDLALKNISRRERSAYARAARWMKDLQEVCALSGKETEWTTFYGRIMTEYRRFRALMEEIRAVFPS
ncbi:MAG: hypothetical protein A4E53_02391 [Pelotomaculum sp. PtaB.Bin104]|nr:MAG: hypothetical protein A4E53_02391 [Pelotomaculum sp. PtaB.Bin104]